MGFLCGLMCVGEETGAVTFSDILKEALRILSVVITHCIVERDEYTEYSDRD